MASRKRRRSPSFGEFHPIRSPLDLLREIPVEIISQRVCPYTIRIIETRDEYRRALDYHISIVNDPDELFPAGYCPIAEWDVSRVTNVIETSEDLEKDIDHHVWIAYTEGESFPMGYRPIGEWDVSIITDFSFVFSPHRNRLLRNFNEDIGDWDVSNGVIFLEMFWGCEQFNADLSRWNVANGTHFRSMFSHCTHFNSDVSHWDVSNGTNSSTCLHTAWTSTLMYHSGMLTMPDFLWLECSTYDCPAFDKELVTHGI